MVRPRRGSSSLGCLFALLLLSAAGYFAVNVGEVYVRFFQFKDAMRQEVRFAAHNSDQVILRHLRAQADSLGLPEAAGEVTLQRDGRHEPPGLTESPLREWRRTASVGGSAVTRLTSIIDRVLSGARFPAGPTSGSSRPEHGEP